MTRETGFSEEKLVKVMNRMKEEYGKPERPVIESPVKSVIRTILSQNTNDQNRDVASGRLFKKFETVEEILKADKKDIEEAVRPAGLGPTKAERIKKFLERLKDEEGRITLEQVESMSKDEAKRYMESFEGIGPKTSAVTLLFVFGKPVMPVDTHVHRVSIRLGIIPKGTTRKRAHDLLEEKVPEERMYSFHINLIKHGRKICKARKPLCSNCVVNGFCRYFRENREG